MIFKIMTVLFCISSWASANESYQVELIRQTVNGTERVLLHMAPRKATMGLTSNMLNFGEKTKIGTFEKKDKKSHKSFKDLYSKLHLQKDPDHRKTTSPHAIEIWVNGKKIEAPIAYKKIKVFAGNFVQQKGWKPIDAKLISFDRNGVVQIESYEGKKKRNVEKFFGAKICKFKMSSYACSTKLGTVYAPEWAARLPGTIRGDQ